MKENANFAKTVVNSAEGTNSVSLANNNCTNTEKVKQVEPSVPFKNNNDGITNQNSNLQKISGQSVTENLSKGNCGSDSLQVHYSSGNASVFKSVSVGSQVHQQGCVKNVNTQNGAAVSGGSSVYTSKSNVQTVCVDAYFVNSAKRIGDAVKRMVKSSAVVLLCVGTDKVVGDSLGPIVGSIMCKRNLHNVYVYGMLDSNITAKNLHYAARFIDVVHPDRVVVVVDAALGTIEQVNTVQICNGGLYPGSATNKNLPRVGDVSILGVVNRLSGDEMATLYSTKMNNVQYLANAIADGLTIGLS